MSTLSTIITQLNANQTSFNTKVRDKLAALNSNKIDNSRIDQAGGVLGLDANKDSLNKMRNLTITGNLNCASITVNGQTGLTRAEAMALAIVLG